MVELFYHAPYRQVFRVLCSEFSFTANSREDATAVFLRSSPSTTILQADQTHFRSCSGTYEPTDEECDFPDAVLADEETLQFLGVPQPSPPSASNTTNSVAPLSPSSSSPASSDAAAAPTAVEGPASGVPQFWLNIFKYVPMFELMVKDTDEPALKHLTDIKVQIAALPDMSFTLQFCFTPNPYFDDAVLTKEYLMKCEPDTDLPFTFDGPEIYSSRGCPIHWKEGMDLTMREIRHKGGPESGDCGSICLFHA